MHVEKEARNYFLTFEQKDLEGLSNMFHEDVVLRDWNIFANGKAAVLDANSSIFDAINKIKVNVENLYISDTTVVAELSIYADDEPALPVVDIIKYVSEGDNLKIKSIVAYRGN